MVANALMQCVPAKKLKYPVLYSASVKRWQTVKILSTEKILTNKSLKYHEEIYVAQNFNFRTKMFLKAALGAIN